MNHALMCGFATLSVVLGGCSTYALPLYSPSGDTVMQLRKLPAAKVAVDAIAGEQANTRVISCRGFTPIQVPEGQSFGEYVRGALRAELQLAGLYDEASKLRLSGMLTQVDYSSGITDASWYLAMTVRSTNGASLVSSASYPFSGSFDGMVACNQTAQAGMGAVQRLVKSIVFSSRFRELLEQPTTPTVGQTSAPVEQGAAVPGTPAVAPGLAPRGVGKDSFVAERSAREANCTKDALATLVGKGPGYEAYSFQCTNGETLIVRCEFGNCRVMK
jgi:hypothetical protein